MLSCRLEDVMSEVVLPELKANYTVRPCTLDDLEAVLALMNIWEMARLGQTEATREDILTDWQRPNFDQAASQRLVTAADGTVVGWVQLESSEKVIQYVDIFVHPDYQNEG